MPDRDAAHVLPSDRGRQAGLRASLRTGLRAGPSPDAWREVAVLIPDTLLLAVCGFGEDLPAERVAAALARGVRAGGMPEPDVCTIEEIVEIEKIARGTAVARTLDALGFDARMRRARAVVVGAGRLDRETLAGSAVFEIATRARQAGVPAFGVTGRNELDAFDARMLDLQVIFEANTPRRLVSVGTKLVGCVEVSPLLF